MSFITCDASIVRTQQFLAILQGNKEVVDIGVNNIVKQVDQAVRLGVYSNTEAVENAAIAVRNSFIGFIPDYTSRDNNIGAALAKFDRDFFEFKDMLERCPYARTREFVSLLGLGQDLPADVGPFELAKMGYSSLRNAMVSVNSFPLKYLQSMREEILLDVSNQIQNAAGNLTEFLTGDGIDSLQSLLPDQIVNIAEKVETTLACIEGIACDNVSELRGTYYSLMADLPLDPPFIPPPLGKVIPVPNYKLDTANILSGTIASSEQKSNITTARNAVTEAMDYSRTLTSKFL